MENQLTSRGGKIAHKTCIQVSFDLHGRAEGGGTFKGNLLSSRLHRLG